MSGDQFPVNSDMVQHWADEAHKRRGTVRYTGVDHQASILVGDLSDWAIVPVGGCGTGKTLQGWERWEQVVREAKESEWKRQAEGDMSVATNPWWNGDEGAGCSEYSAPIPAARPELETLGWVVIETLPDDPRECRRMISEQLQKFGDLAWEAARVRKGWANGGA